MGKYNLKKKTQSSKFEFRNSVYVLHIHMDKCTGKPAKDLISQIYKFRKQFTNCRIDKTKLSCHNSIKTTVPIYIPEYGVKCQFNSINLDRLSLKNQIKCVGFIKKIEIISNIDCNNYISNCYSTKDLFHFFYIVNCL